MMTRPSFMDSPYFSFGDDDGPWELKEGAPEDVRKEFDEYMKQRKEDERDGVIA